MEDSDVRYNFTKDSFLCSRCRTLISKIIDTQGKFKWETQVETETTSEITDVDQPGPSGSHKFSIDDIYSESSSVPYSQSSDISSECDMDDINQNLNFGSYKNEIFL